MKWQTWAVSRVVSKVKQCFPWIWGWQFVFSKNPFQFIPILFTTIIFWVFLILTNLDLRQIEPISANGHTVPPVFSLSPLHWTNKFIQKSTMLRQEVNQRQNSLHSELNFTDVNKNWHKNIGESEKNYMFSHNFLVGRILRLSLLSISF